MPTPEDLLKTISACSSHEVDDLRDALVKKGLKLGNIEFDSIELLDITFALRKHYGFVTPNDVPITEYRLPEILQAIPAVN